MAMTGMLGSAFGAVKAKGLGALRVAQRNMGDAGRRMVGRSANNQSTTRLAGNLGGRMLAGGGGVMKGATGTRGVMQGAADAATTAGKNLPVARGTTQVAQRAGGQVAQTAARTGGTAGGGRGIGQAITQGWRNMSPTARVGTVAGGAGAAGGFLGGRAGRGR